VANAAASGKSVFSYTDDDLARVPRSEWKVHEALDPKGVTFRESRDSEEHPTSLAIAVLFDVTGSMHTVPRLMQEKLPELFGLLLRKGYAEDPQILFGGIGDAFWDKAPLQVGQFESDNRLDENLGNILLEGGGGGGNHESYELAMYFMAEHTSTDCWELRGHRGYCFIIGDEKSYDTLDSGQVRDIIGDELAEPLTTAQVVQRLQETFDVYYLHPAGGSYREEPGNETFWRGLLGQQYIRLDDDDAVCETIAVAIGLGEGTVDLDTGIEDLKEIGSTHAETVGRALATVGSRGAIAESESPADLDEAEGGGAERL
jgi:hypothetical protein